VAQLPADQSTIGVASSDWQNTRHELNGQHASQGHGSGSTHPYPQTLYQPEPFAHTSDSALLPTAGQSGSVPQGHIHQSTAPIQSAPQMPFTSADWMQNPVDAFNNMFGEFYGMGLPHDLDAQNFGASLDHLPPQELHDASALADLSSYSQTQDFPTLDNFTSWPLSTTNWRWVMSCNPLQRSMLTTSPLS
jgi:hypothetical protein